MFAFALSTRLLLSMLLDLLVCVFRSCSLLGTRPRAARTRSDLGCRRSFSGTRGIGSGRRARIGYIRSGLLRYGFCVNGGFLNTWATGRALFRSRRRSIAILAGTPGHALLGFFCLGELATRNGRLTHLGEGAGGGNFIGNRGGCRRICSNGLALPCRSFCSRLLGCLGTRILGLNLARTPATFRGLLLGSWRLGGRSLRSIEIQLVLVLVSHCALIFLSLPQ